MNKDQQIFKSNRKPICFVHCQKKKNIIVNIKMYNNMNMITIKSNDKFTN